MQEKMSIEEEIVGLIPAGGLATRLSPLPCSKELIPIGYRKDFRGNLSPKVVSHYLLEKYKNAGIRKTYFILRKGKWDIPQYYGDGTMVEMELAYLIMNLPHGHPFTIDQAFPFTKKNSVVFGYPDILFEPDDAFAQLIKKQKQSKACVVLGIFPIKAGQRWGDILRFASDGKIETISLAEPSGDDPPWGWAIAYWTPEFSVFMHEFLDNAVRQNKLLADDGKEYTMNHLFQAALDGGLAMDHIVFDAGYVLDVGTPDDLMAAQRSTLFRD